MACMSENWVPDTRDSEGNSTICSYRLTFNCAACWSRKQGLVAQSFCCHGSRASFLLKHHVACVNLVPARPQNASQGTTCPPWSTMRSSSATRSSRARRQRRLLALLPPRLRHTPPPPCHPPPIMAIDQAIPPQKGKAGSTTPASATTTVAT